MKPGIFSLGALARAAVDRGRALGLVRDNFFRTVAPLVVTADFFPAIGSLSLRYHASPFDVCFESQTWSSLSAIWSRSRPVTTLLGSASVTLGSLLVLSKSSCSLMSSQFGFRSLAALPPMRTNVQLPFILAPYKVNLSEPRRSPSSTSVW